MKNVIFLTTIIISTVVAFASHVLIQGWEDQVSASHSHLFEEARSTDKFSFFVVLIAGITALLPVAIAYWVLSVIWQHIPGKHWWVKGLLYSIVLLIIKSELIRTPIMGMVMGVPIWLVGASQLDVWIPNILLGLILAFGVHKSNINSAKHIANSATS